MASGQVPQDAIQPLTVGNVVSAGIRLYRSHLGQYLGIAVRATLWILLPFLGFSLAFYLAREQAVVIALLILAVIVAYFFCTAKFLTNSALISRLAFSELVNQPESLSEARTPIDRRLWRFLGAACLLSLICSRRLAKQSKPRQSRHRYCYWADALHLTNHFSNGSVLGDCPLLHL
jgi:hypothetical protein